MEDNIVLTGVVCSGRGIASQGIDADRAGEILCAIPCPGTLNITMNYPLILLSSETMDAKGKQYAISGTINGIPCLVYRWRNAPLHVIEIISAEKLREALSLKDGQSVNVTIPKRKAKSPNNFRTKIWNLFYKNRPQSYYDDSIYPLFVSRGLKFFHKKICQSNSEFSQ